MLSAAHAFRLTSLTLLLVLGIAVLKERRRGLAASATLAFLASLACYLTFPELTGWPRAPLPAWAHPLLAGRDAVPFTFWLLSRTYFDDEFRPRPVHGLLLLVQVGFNHAGALALTQPVSFAPTSPAERELWTLLPKAVSATLVLHALAGIVAGSRGDLVEARLRLRRLVLVVIGGYALLVLAGEVLLRGADEARLADALNAGAIFLLVLAFAALFLKLEPELLRAPQRAAPEPAVDPVLAQGLQRLLESEQVFREEGLTIRALAERLGVPEYKLRRHINAQLGFRNFNAFLNHHRVRRARDLLDDPGQSHLSVAEIAYGLGYGSLGPFNRAFKDLTGATPTEFRARTPGAAGDPADGGVKPPPTPAARSPRRGPS